MRVKLQSQLDDGVVILPVGSVIDMPDEEAAYLLSVGAAEAAPVENFEEAVKPPRRARARE